MFKPTVELIAYEIHEYCWRTEWRNLYVYNINTVDHSILFTKCTFMIFLQKFFKLQASNEMRKNKLKACLRNLVSGNTLDVTLKVDN